MEFLGLQGELAESEMIRKARIEKEQDRIKGRAAAAFTLVEGVVGCAQRRRFTLASRRNAAFTLVEAIVSFGIFGVCFGALLAGLTFNASGVKFARETVRATQIMEEKLDTLRLYSWDQIMTPGFITNQFQAPFSPASALTSSNSAGVTYTGTIAIATAPLTEGYKTNIMQITVDVYWPSKPLVRHAQMSTFVSKYGMQGYIY